jgi:hypothetical protein
MAPDAAMWGSVPTVTDNESARHNPESDSAYERVDSPGIVAAPRGFALGVGKVGKEPIAVWLMVVGSIAALFVIGKTFKMAKA